MPLGFLCDRAAVFNGNKMSKWMKVRGVDLFADCRKQPWCSGGEPYGTCSYCHVSVCAACWVRLGHQRCPCVRPYMPHKPPGPPLYRWEEEPGHKGVMWYWRRGQ